MMKTSRAIKRHAANSSAMSSSVMLTTDTPSRRGQQERDATHASQPPGFAGGNPPLLEELQRQEIARLIGKVVRAVRGTSST